MRSRILPGLFLLLALAAPALAAGSGATSLDRILPQIRRNTPGTFYDAQGPFPGPDGQARYRLKWMTPDGRIIWFDADARSGRVLGMSGEGHYNGGQSRGGESQDRSSGQHFRDDRDHPDRFNSWPGSGYGGGHGDWNRDGRGGRDDGDRGGRGGDRGGHGRHGG
jgi:hypothetical protein